MDYIISEVRTQIKQSLNRWYVGTSEWADVWRRTQAEIIVFNLLDTEATKAAYDQLVSQGMKGKKPIGKEANYLYLYSIDGRLPDGFVY
jgi:hypothetical protein